MAGARGLPQLLVGGKGGGGRFAGFPPLPRSLSDLDLQMFYYADALMESFLLFISWPPQAGGWGDTQVPHPDSLLWEFIHKQPGVGCQPGSAGNLAENEAKTLPS